MITETIVRKAVELLLILPARLDFNEAEPSYHVAYSTFGALRETYESGDSDLRAILRQTIEAAEDRLRPDRLGAMLLDMAHARVMLAAPENWFEIGPGFMAPSPTLVESLKQRAERARSRPCALTPLHSGISSFLAGDDFGAFRHFGEAAAHRHFFASAHDDLRGAASCRSFPSLAQHGDCRFPFQLADLGHVFPEPIGAMKWLIKPEMKPGHGVMNFTCDDLYFRVFSTNIVKSLPANAEGLQVHFHVVNLSSAGRRQAQRLLGAASEKKFNLFVSFEHTRVKDRAYFACSRFLRLPEFLDQFRAPVLMLETDCEIGADPREWLRAFPGDAVSLLVQKGPWGSGYLPWRAIWAGVVYTPANRQGRTFAKLLQSVIGYLWHKEHNNNWWIDQNALYATYRILQRYWSGSGFHSIESGLPHGIKTSSEMKLSMLTADPEVAGLMAGGLDWERAVSEIQLSAARQKPDAAPLP